MRRHRQRIVAHLRFQRRHAWPLGGPWYGEVRLRDLDDRDRLTRPEVFAVVAAAIGFDRLRADGVAEQRGFARQPTTADTVYVLPSAGARRRERARVLDAGVLGMRVRAAGTSLASVPVGRTVLIETARGRVRCVKRWQRFGQAGLEIVAADAGSASAGG